MASAATLSERARHAIGRRAYDFYACDRCRRLITQLEVTERLEAGVSSGLCTCGSARIRPSNFQWSGLLRPAVWRFARLRIADLGWRGIVLNGLIDVAAWTLKRITLYHVSLTWSTYKRRGDIIEDSPVCILAPTKRLADVIAPLLVLAPPAGDRRFEGVYAGDEWTPPAPPPEPAKVAEQLESFVRGL